MAIDGQPPSIAPGHGKAKWWRLLCCCCRNDELPRAPPPSPVNSERGSPEENKRAEIEEFNNFQASGDQPVSMVPKETPRETESEAQQESPSPSPPCVQEAGLNNSHTEEKSLESVVVEAPPREESERPGPSSCIESVQEAGENNREERSIPVVSSEWSDEWEALMQLLERKYGPSSNVPRSPEEQKKRNNTEASSSPWDTVEASDADTLDDVSSIGEEESIPSEIPESEEPVEMMVVVAAAAAPDVSPTESSEQKKKACSPIEEENEPLPSVARP